MIIDKELILYLIKFVTAIIGCVFLIRYFNISFAVEKAFQNLKNFETLSLVVTILTSLLTYLIIWFLGAVGYYAFKIFTFE